MCLLNVIFLAVLAGYASTATIDDCPSKVPREHLKVFKDVCYMFTMNRGRDWPGALSECQSFGGTLAMIKSKEVNDFLVNSMWAYGRRTTVWIGLTDMDTEGDFYWEDRTKLDYSNWGPLQGGLQDGIVHGNDDCVAIDPYGKWFDYPCQSTVIGPNLKPFICQFLISGPGATSPSVTV